MKTTLQLGAPLETLTPGELDQSLARQTEAFYQQLARGVGYLRFGPVGPNPPGNGGAFTLDGTNHRQLGPRTGWIWSVRRLTITGLATGATPDVVSIYRNSPTGVPIWELNGNFPYATFGKGEMILLDGETFSVAGTGLATTANVQISGDYYQVPAEQIFKLF